MNQPQAWQLFVSYSHVDRQIVTPLIELIRITGVPTFRDEDSIPKGKRWKMVIAESLASAKTLLVFWSLAASDSKAVEEEFNEAVEQGKDIVPVLLDDTELPLLLRDYQWIDLRSVVGGAIDRSIKNTVLQASISNAAIALLPRADSVIWVWPTYRIIKNVVAMGGVMPQFTDEEKMSISEFLAERILVGD